MEEINKWLQDLDPKSSPHKEEEWIGGVVDLDLLFQIPEEYARIIGGMERKQAFDVQQWSRRERANRMVDITSSRKKKDYL